MKPVCRAAAVRELDRRIIEDQGLPSLALMEAAVSGLAHGLLEHVPAIRDASVCVACGPGNNGGDGWALARWLHGWGIDVSVWPVLPPATDDARVMAEIARRIGVREVAAPSPETWIIDALFGTGLSRPLDGVAAEATARFAVHRVIAVDLPSGLDADTGQWRGPAFDAVATLTLGRWKPALFVGEGPLSCGETRLIDIGLDAVGQPDDAAAWLLEPSDVRWPARRSTDHKGRSGHVLVVAGSVAMAGAAILACEGALAAGAGLVTLRVPPAAVPRLSALPPEVMVVTDDLPFVQPASYDAVVVGPGLGGGQPLLPEVRDILMRWWAEAAVPLVFDADALRCTTVTTTPHPRVLTPHPGEAGRLLGISARDVEADRLSALERLRDRGTVLLKGRHTLVADPDRITINPTGSPALATGGSGDVLAGVVGALLGRGVPAGPAARFGAYVHGATGDALWADRRVGWRARDIASRLPDVANAFVA
ncbi:MAG: NAD(P)H-hydrate dehydratase [Myxococcota bacterium]